MAGRTPRFSLALGGLRSDSDRAAGGPRYFAVDRSLDVPVDGLRVVLAERAGVEPGDPAELELGDEDGLERVFTGSVVEVRPHPGGAEVFAAGSLLALIELRVSAFYQAQSAGDIARDLIGQAGLDTGEISDGISLPRFAIDRRRGAHPQLRALADRLGYDLFADRTGKIHFRGLGAVGNLDVGGLGGLGAAAAGAVSALAGGGLAFGVDLLAASARKARDPARKIVVGGESPMSGQGDDKSFWLTAKDSDFEDSAGDGDELLIVDPLARTKDMAGRFAAGRHARLARSQRALTIRVPGDGGLELGAALDTRDAPDELLEARGFISALRHRFGAGVGFTTEATLCVEAS